MARSRSAKAYAYDEAVSTKGKEVLVEKISFAGDEI